MAVRRRRVSYEEDDRCTIVACLYNAVKNDYIDRSTFEAILRGEGVVDVDAD